MRQHLFGVGALSLGAIGTLGVHDCPCMPLSDLDMGSLSGSKNSSEQYLALETKVFLSLCPHNLGKRKLFQNVPEGLGIEYSEKMPAF